MYAKVVTPSTLEEGRWGGTESYVGINITILSEGFMCDCSLKKIGREMLLEMANRMTIPPIVVTKDRWRQHSTVEKRQT